ncbi:MAG: hypothetical protein SNJ59_16245 [Aggregatilineales bacterium]
MLTITHAPQTAPPAMLYDTSGLTMFWIGSDAAGVHHDGRWLRDGTLGTPVILPLPPVHPRAQTVFPANRNGSHLLWLDADTAGEIRLFNALITPELTVERGPVDLSRALALNYAALPEDDGTLWVAFSGGSIAEPAIYLTRVDPTGRPQPARVVSPNGRHPALARDAAGGLHLLWLGDGELMRAQIVEGQVTEPIRASAGAYIGPGDRLHSLRAGTGDEHIIVFWNLTRANGGQETWFTSGRPEERHWRAPTRLRIDEDGALSAEEGLSPVLASPLAGWHEELPAAVQTDEGIGIVWFHNGLPNAFQLAAPSALTLDVPSFVETPDGQVAIGWAQPALNDAAALNVLLLTLD